MWPQQKRSPLDQARLFHSDGGLIMAKSDFAQLILAPSMTSVHAAFDFGSYMTERAKMVNQALDAAVPLKYPEDLTESMRCEEETPESQALLSVLTDALYITSHVANLVE